MKSILKAVGLAVGLAMPLLAAGAPAGNYIVNISTVAKKPVFSVSSGTVAGQFSPISIKWPNGSVQVSSPTAGGAGGVVVPSTFTWGTVALSTFTASSATVTGQFSPKTIRWPDGTIQISSPTAGGISLSSAVFCSSGSVTPDARLASNVFVAVDATCVLHGPTNPYDGQKMTFRLSQDSSGHTVTFTTGSSGEFAYGSDIFGFTNSAARLIDYVGAVYEGVSNRWHIVSVSRGYSNGFVAPAFSVSLTAQTHFGTIGNTSLSAGASALSVSVWFKGTTMLGRQLLGTTSAGTANGGWAIYSDDATGQIEFYVTKPSNGGSHQRTTDNTSLYNGSWHNVISTYDGITIHIYFDGVEPTYASFGGSALGSNFTSTDFLSVGDSTIYEGTQEGKYAYPAVYFSTLSSAQAAAIAAGTNLGGAAAQWLFSEGFGTTAADSSGNGHTLTFNTIDAWSSDVPF